MHKKTHAPLSLLLFIVVLAPLFAHAESNTACNMIQPLRLGVHSNDVSVLQRILNTDVRTQVSAQGVGSLGNETNYFGAKTFDAVKRFQSIYKNEILLPAGLTSASGYVGVLTLAHLRTVCAKTLGASPQTAAVAPPPPAPSVTPTTGTSAPPPISATGADLPIMPDQNSGNSLSGFAAFFMASTTDDLRVYSVSAQVTHRKESLIIYGTGFAQDSVVHLGEQVIADARIDGKTSINITLPENLPFGRMLVWVSNSHGVSNKDTYISVVDVGAVAPSVISVSPLTVIAGGTVTIVGAGFTPSNNEVVTSLGLFPNIASQDGKTLQFNLVPNIDGYNNTVSQAGDSTFPIVLYVVNQNGQSNVQQLRVTM